jgi:phospholipid transport system substrate-binding protein
MKILLHFIFVFLLFTPYAQAANLKGADDLKVYAEKIIDEVYDIFNDKTLSIQARTEKIKEFIKENLYLEWMAKFTLGRHRKTIPQAKINEFVKVYSEFIVKAYSDLSTSYSGEKAILKNIKQIDDDMYMIHMELVKPNGQPPIKIDYLVHKIDNDKTHPYRVGDIITEGISILNSQQAEFNNVITTHGIDGLMKDLRSRATSNKTIAAQ